MGSLADWLEGMQPRVAGLVDFEMPVGSLPDYSAASLARLEAELVGRGEPGADFLDRVVGYLGEALLTVAGGQWGWDGRRDLPVVLPDPELGLPAVRPAELVERALHRRDGDEFGRTYAYLAQAVAAKQAQASGWTPTKQPTPGLDRRPNTVRSEFLDGWLAERAAGLPDWLGKYAQRQELWDFSPESLDALEAAARDLVPGPAELSGHPEFADGAVWYLGEVLRPAMRAQWCYVPGELDANNMFVGRPYLEQPVPNGSATVPFLLLQIVLHDRTPGLLRKLFEQRI